MFEWLMHDKTDINQLISDLEHKKQHNRLFSLKGSITDIPLLHNFLKGNKNDFLILECIVDTSNIHKNINNSFVFDLMERYFSKTKYIPYDCKARNDCLKQCIKELNPYFPLLTT